MTTKEAQEVIAHVRGIIKFKRQAQHLGLRDLMKVCAPIATNPLRTWDSVLCLCGRATQPGKESCHICRGASRGPEHAAKIKEGMARARDRA